MFVVRVPFDAHCRVDDFTSWPQHVTKEIAAHVVNIEAGETRRHTDMRVNREPKPLFSFSVKASRKAPGIDLPHARVRVRPRVGRIIVWRDAPIGEVDLMPLWRKIWGQNRCHEHLYQHLLISSSSSVTLYKMSSAAPTGDVITVSSKSETPPIHLPIRQLTRVNHSWTGHVPVLFEWAVGSIGTCERKKVLSVRDFEMSLATIIIVPDIPVLRAVRDPFRSRGVVALNVDVPPALAKAAHTLNSSGGGMLVTEASGRTWTVRTTRAVRAGAVPLPLILNGRQCQFMQKLSKCYDSARKYSGARVSILMCNPRAYDATVDDLMFVRNRETPCRDDTMSCCVCNRTLSGYTFVILLRDGWWATCVTCARLVAIKCAFDIGRLGRLEGAVIVRLPEIALPADGERIRVLTAPLAEVRPFPDLNTYRNTTAIIQADKATLCSPAGFEKLVGDNGVVRRIADFVKNRSGPPVMIDRLVVVWG